MARNSVPILFMDDEIGNPAAIVVKSAVEALRSKGYEVKTTEKLSEALDEFYNKYYRVFVLDIDMSHADDEIKGRGTKAARLYKSLDNSAAVIMFSGAGTNMDWFELANHHIFGYVRKDARPDPVTVLLEMVEKAVDSVDRSFCFPEQRNSGKICIANTPKKAFEDSEFKKLVESAGDFTVEFVDFDQLPEKAESGNYSAVIVAARFFDSRPSTAEIIEKIARLSPEPNVIFACDGSDEYRETIINILNNQPFRLINLSGANAKDELQRAVKDAAFWYGAKEIFEADKNDVTRLARDINWKEVDDTLEGLDEQADIPVDEGHGES